MYEHEKVFTLCRRSMLGKLAGIAGAFVGLSAFRRVDSLTNSLSASSLRAPKWDERFELAVDVEVAQQRGGRSHRPYVAVWVEDSAGKPVRTLSLWVNLNDRGPRYINELRQWYSGPREIGGVGGPDLITTVSGATKLPGLYTLTWNGKDDHGKKVDQGSYRVVIEAAREHGSYQIMHQDVLIGATPVASDITGNMEIGRARVDYRLRK